MRFFRKKSTICFLLLNLSINGEEKHIQENVSKTNNIKMVINSMKEKYVNSHMLDSKNELLKIKMDSNKNITESNGTYNKKIAEYDRLLQINSINELMSCYQGSDNNVINRLVNIFKEFLQSLDSNYSDLLKKYSHGSEVKGNLNIYDLERIFFLKKL